MSKRIFGSKTGATLSRIKKGSDYQKKSISRKFLFVVGILDEFIYNSEKETNVYTERKILLDGYNFLEKI